MGKVVRATCGLFGLLASLLLSAPLCAQTAQILPNAKTQFLDAQGAPLVGGLVYTCVPNTNNTCIPGSFTPKTTWRDAFQVTANANPVVLDSAGSAFIFGSGNYAETLYDQFGNLIWSGFTWVIPTGTAGAKNGDIPTFCNNGSFCDNASIATGQGLYLGSGRPWVDVRSGANGCAVAAGNGSTDDQPALQCQSDYLNSTFGGGILYACIGNFHVATTLTIKGNTFIQGCGNATSSISISTDITALAFDSSVVYGGLDKFTVFGNQSTAATATLVTVANGIIVNFSNCELTGGNWALGNNGVDGNVSNCTIQGFGTSGGGVLSAGGNTYYNAKIDQAISASLTAFKQTTAYDGGVKENRIISSDLSGSYTHALVIADTNNLAITTITNTAFSSAPISITGAATTMLNAVELGATSLAASGKIVITGSSGTAGLATVSGGMQTCAGNNNILCNSTPSIASGACGTAANGVLGTGSTDQSGLVEIGSASTTSCTISFSGTLGTTPLSCVIFPANATAAAQGTTVARVSTVGASNWVITGSVLASTNYYYRCG